MDTVSPGLLWVRCRPERSILKAHLRQVCGRFRSSGWRIVAGGEPPTGATGQIAVLDDPWVEPLPVLAAFLAAATTPDSLMWRVPLVSGLSGPQAWNPSSGPYTLVEYEGRCVRRRHRLGRPLVGHEPWHGFAVAPSVESLGVSGWPPAADQVAVVPGGRLYRYADPADQERLELDRFIPSETGTLIDVGCGTGRFAARQRRTGRHVVGIEAEWPLARQAARRLDLVLAASAEEMLRALRGPVDCLVFADVLEHMIDPAAVLGIAADLLSPCGRIVVSLPSVAWAPVVRALAAGRWDTTLAGIQARDHLVSMTLDSFLAMAAQCGLRPQEVTPLPYRLSVGLRLWAWLAARSAGGSPRALSAPQWIVVLERTDRPG